MSKDINVQEVEYLTTTAGIIDEVGEVVIVTLRPDEGSFRPHNIALTAKQGQRLQVDLNRLFENSKILRGWKKRNPTAIVEGESEDD